MRESGHLVMASGLCRLAIPRQLTSSPRPRSAAAALQSGNPAIAPDRQKPQTMKIWGRCGSVDEYQAAAVSGSGHEPIRSGRLASAQTKAYSYSSISSQSSAAIDSRPSNRTSSPMRSTISRREGNRK